MSARKSYPVPVSELVTLEELARRTSIHPQVLEQLVRFGLLDPVEPPHTRREPTRRTRRVYLFRREEGLKARRILRIRHDFGGSFQSAGLVLELVERIEELEREIGTLRRLRG